MGIESVAENGPVVVCNRDIPLLTEVNCIMQDIRQIEHRRQWQKERMANISQHLTGMPGCSGSPKGLDNAFVLLSEIDDEHMQRCRDYVLQLRRAQEILDGIKSRSMRTFVIMKYISDEPDIKIRKELKMSKHRFYQARQCIESASCMAAVTWQEKYVLSEE